MLKINPRTIINYTVAILLMLFGLFGAVVPGVPGIIPFAMGLVVLAIQNETINHHIELRINRYIKLEKIYRKVKKQIEQYIRKG